MLKSLLLSLILSFSSYIYSSSEYGVALAPIHSDRITYHEHQIAQRMSRDVWLKRVALGALAGGVAWGIYQIFFVPASQSAIELVTPIPSSLPLADQTNVPCNIAQELSIIKSEIATINTTVAMAMYAPIYPETWMQFFKRYARYYANTGTTNVIFGLIMGRMAGFNKYFITFDEKVDKTVDYIFHDQSIEWLYTTQLKQMNMVSMLIEQAICLEGESGLRRNNQEHTQASLAVFARTWDLAMEQVALLAAYLRVKHDQALKKNERVAHLFQEQSARIVVWTDDTRALLEEILHGKMVDGHTLSTVLKRLREQIEGLVKEIGQCEALI